MRSLPRFLVRLTLVVPIATLLLFPLQTASVHAATAANFNAGRIMDDHIFFGSANMSVQDIQNFLNSKVPICDTYGTQMYGGTTRAAYSAARGHSTPFTCLKDYSQAVTEEPADAYCSGAISAGTQSAAQIIYNVANACGINAKVLIVLLQKEQGLVTDDWPWSTQFQKATGYGCPDSASCDTDYYGFFNQVYNAAHQFQRYTKQAHLFNYQANQSAYIGFSPSSGCGGSTIFIQNKATASLYNYTPYQPNQAALDAGYGTVSCGAYGNRNFYLYYSDWFGPTTGIYCSLAPSNPTQADVLFGGTETNSNVDFAHLVTYQGTSTNCVEGHTWTQNYGNWQQHMASNMPVVDPRSAVVQYADIAGTGYDVPILVGLNGTGSGNVEFHVWNNTMSTWTLHVASNMGAINPDGATIEFADIDGSGRDVPVLVGYNGTGSGYVEFHVWNSNMTTWNRHAATSMGPINPTTARIVFADVDGNNRDVPVLVGYSGTGSGNVEFHVWNSDLSSWNRHAATTMGPVSPTTVRIDFADIDGSGRDVPVLVGLHGTGSGMIEFHTWSSNLSTWSAHYASNQAQF